MRTVTVTANPSVISDVISMLVDFGFTAEELSTPNENTVQFKDDVTPSEFIGSLRYRGINPADVFALFV